MRDAMKRCLRSLVGFLPMFVGISTFGQEELPGPTSQVIVAGPLTIRVSLSRTAHLFHVVDQLSAWSPFCHAQYRRDFEASGGLDAGDRQMLAEHAALRKEKGWGNGLEQAFYTDLALDAALTHAKEFGYLTQEQARTEQAVLTHFAPRIDRLRLDQEKTLSTFRVRLETGREELAALVRPLSRFCGREAVDLPVFLIANPSSDSIGGGFNGGRLTLEVPSGRDAFPSFLHEVFHAFLDAKQPLLERSAAGVPGLVAQTLNEGMAYAFAPGIVHPKHGAPDPLRDQVASDVAAKKTLKDDYTRFHRFGLALRPSLTKALDDPSETLESFLPRAVAVWLAVREVSQVWDEMGTTPPKAEVERVPMISFGPGWRALTERMRRQGINLSSRNHTAEAYREALERIDPEGTLVFLFAADHPDQNVPKAFQDLLPLTWAEVEDGLHQGRTLQKSGKSRGRKVVLLMAPTEGALELLIRNSEWLAP